MKNKFTNFLKKRVVSLKRNFYTLPFALICICCFFLQAILYILIKSVGRIEYKPASIFLFIAVLMSVLMIVAIVSYTKKVYGQKRPLKMLIIYYVIVAILLAFTALVFYFNEMQIQSEIINRDRLEPLPGGSMPAEWFVFQTYINYGICSRTLLIIFFALELIANGLLIASPFIEKQLKKIHFDNPSNEKK